MVMDPVSRVSASTIAGATVLAVTDITNPTELNSRIGYTNGALCLVTQNVAGANEWTLYAFDATSSASVNSPYILAASGSGQWIAIAGKYRNGAIASPAGVTASQFTSTVATGTAPLVVASTTAVANLNASLLLGATWAAPGTIGSGTPSTGAFTTLTANNAVTLTAGTASTSTSTGTLVVTGGVGVSGAIYAGSLQNTPIGSTTANTGAFTTISASGQITSTVSTGTAPLVIASTTAVANLNASLLLGSTWVSPGTIGSTTPNTGSFTTLGASGVTSITNATASTSTSTGALVVTGGIGVGGSCYFNGDLLINNKIRSSSGDAGNVYITGGSATSSVANITLYGSTSGQANRIFYDASSHFFRSVAGAAMLTLDGSTVAASQAATITVTDSGTGNEPYVLALDHATSGTPAAGFGTRLVFRSQTTTTASQDQFLVLTQWNTATHASRTTDVYFYCYDSGGARNGLYLGANGSAPTIGFLGAVAQTRVTFAAATGTADRTTFDTTTVTTAALAQRVKAIIDDLRSFGLYG